MLEVWVAVGFNFFAEVLFNIGFEKVTDITASRVLLVVLLGADVPNVLTQGLVLALTLESQLVKRHLVWICQAGVHHCCHSSELSLVVFLRLRVSGRTRRVRLGVVELTCLAVREADFVALSHFAVDYLHGESIFYMCHSCSAIERRVRNSRGSV